MSLKASLSHPQRKRAVRAIYKLGSRDSLGEIDILTVPSQYIYANIMYVRKNLHTFPKNCGKHTLNTRNKNKLVQPLSRLSKIHDYFQKYTFLCERYDPAIDRVVELVLNFFPFDNSVQVTNPEKGIILLRRVHMPQLSVDMLQIGNIVNVFGRLLFLKECPAATTRTLFYKVESTFALIKPTPPELHGKVLTFIVNKGFRITRMRNGRISKDFAMEMYKSIAENNMLPIIIDYIISDEVIGLELSAREAVTRWRQCLGATDPKEAAPDTLRGMYAQNKLQNIAHGCQTLEEATKMNEEYFGYANGVPKIPLRATFKDCTCCIVKPHAILDGNLGSIIEHINISGKFYITAMAMFTVKLTDAKEFFEIYKGVLLEYEQMSIHLAEGKCVVLEIKCKDPSLNAVCQFRKLCGPRDPDMARQLYPDCIRALYGKNMVHNAVHCTDLPEDGVLEVEYFFKLLATE